MKNYLVSTGSLPLASSKQFTDYTVIPDIYKMLDIDGLELVFLPEWNKENKPLTFSSVDWNQTIKLNLSELVEYIKMNNLNIPVVHLNRDIGNYLCSNNPLEVEIGERILEENLIAAKQIGSKLAVIHLWNTYSEYVNVVELFNKVYKVSSNYDIGIAFENIPLSDKSKTMFDVWKILSDLMPSNYGFTLDLNWCSLYNNFNDLFKFNKRILNIHVQGIVTNINNQITIKPRVGELNILECLKVICDNYYQNYITLELHNPKNIGDFKNGIEIIKQYSN